MEKSVLDSPTASIADQLQQSMLDLGAQVAAFARKNGSAAHPINLLFATTAQEAKIEALANLLVSKGLLTPEEVQTTTLAAMKKAASELQQLAAAFVLHPAAAANGSSLKHR